MKSFGLILALGAAFLWATGASEATGQEISYTGSVQYASGSYYFTERTGSFYFNNGLGVTADRISAFISVPFIAQNTPWISYTNTGVGTLPTGGPQSGMVDNNHNSNGMGGRRGTRRIDLGSADTLNFTKTHLGDPSVNGQIKLYTSDFGKTSISGTFGIKFPIADPNSGFGTGAWDVGTGFSWAQRISDNWLLMMSGSYWWLGDMDELDFNNIVSYSTAIGQSFRSGKLMATANLFGSTRIIEDIDPPLSTGVGLGIQATSSINLNTNVLFGLTESASDFSVGFGWSLKL